MSDPGPLLIFADTYREACVWALEHGYAPREGTGRAGLTWWYALDWRRLQGRSRGSFVDLRRETVTPHGGTDYLLDLGFIDLTSNA